MTDTEIYIDGHATSTFRTLYESLEEQWQVIVQKYKQADRDFYSQTLLAAEVKEEDFFCHVTHKTWDAILHDIRKAHEHDIDSTPDYSLAKKMGLEIRKAIQSSGDYLGKVWAVIFNMLGMDFYKLSPDEQKTFKKVLSKSPAIKNSPVNFRRKKMKTAVVRMDFPTTAVNLGDNIHFLFFCYWSCEVHPLRNASCNSILPRKNKVNY